MIHIFSKSSLILLSSYWLIISDSKLDNYIVTVGKGQEGTLREWGKKVSEVLGKFCTHDIVEQGSLRCQKFWMEALGIFYFAQFFVIEDVSQI